MRTVLVTVLAILPFMAYASVDQLEERDWRSVGDGLITYDPTTQLEWLDLTFTSGNSILDTESEDFFGEFRWATGDEIISLWDHALGEAHDSFQWFVPCDEVSCDDIRTLQTFIGIIESGMSYGVTRRPETDLHPTSYIFTLLRTVNGVPNVEQALWADAADEVAENGIRTLFGAFGSFLVREPAPDVSINIVGGDTQECSDLGGSWVTLEARSRVAVGDSISTIDWEVNGTPVANGSPVDVFASLGTNTLTVSLLTNDGFTDSSTDEIQIEDTVSPDISLAFVDTKTGGDLSQVTSGDEVLATYVVVDVCDPDPIATATAGANIISGDALKPKVSKKGGEMSVTIKGNGSSDLQMTVGATDASGNASEESTSITVVK
jgi:hypothetical protein